MKITLNKPSPVIAALTILLFSSMTAVAATECPTYTYSDVVIAGATEVDSYAINNNGVITGDYIVKNGTQYGFILDGKKLTKITNKSCASGLTFYGINSSEELAGTCIGAKTDGSIAFTYSKGKFTTISPPGAAAAAASGINDSGDVVGTFVDASGALHGFAKIGATYTTLDPKGDSSAAAVNGWAINNTEDITIYWETSTPVIHSYTTANDGKTYATFSYKSAGSIGTAIHGIDSAGDIDGTYFDSSSQAHGLLYLKNGKKYCELNDPDASAANGGTRADGINDTLDVVGRYTDSSKVIHGFLAKP
jgi:hypothetical protein